MNDVIKINKPFLGSAEFIAAARQAVFDIVRQQLDPTDEVKLSIDDIYEVTMYVDCYVRYAQHVFDIELNG